MRWELNCRCGSALTPQPFKNWQRSLQQKPQRERQAKAFPRSKGWYGRPWHQANRQNQFAVRETKDHDIDFCSFFFKAAGTDSWSDSTGLFISRIFCAAPSVV